MRRFILLAFAMVLALVFAMGVQLTAHAGDGQSSGATDQQPPQGDPPPVEVPSFGPPKSVLMEGDKELQKGRLGTYCWGACVDWLAFPNPASTARVAPGSTLHIRIKHAERPTHVHLFVGKTLDPPPWWVRHSFSLKPVVVEGQTVAWDAFFSVKRPDRHYYIDFGAYWKGRDASWGFHLKTRKGWLCKCWGL